jgi:hypothetical protein
MGIVFISEYADSGFVTGPVAVGKEPAISNQLVTSAVGTAQSAAFKSNTRLVRVHTDTAIYYRFGTNPTAVTATDAKMAANQTEYFQVMPGDKIAVIL